MTDTDDLHPHLSDVEFRLSAVEAMVEQTEERVSGVEGEFQKLREDMHQRFDQQRRLLFLMGAWLTLVVTVVQFI